jgi:hypothetical protein
VFSPQVQDVVMAYAYALLTGNKAAIARVEQNISLMPARAAENRKAVAADRARRASRPQTTALPLSAFVGRYANDAFGTLDVTLRDGRIHVRNGVLESVAEVFDGAKNALRVELTPGTGGVLEFHATDGRITAVSFAGARLERVK